MEPNVNTHHSPRLCIIEDEPELRELMAAYLIQCGFSCWQAGSAEAYFTNFPNQPTDIAVVDLNLPGRSGLEVVQFLADQPQIGVVVLTAAQTTDIEMACLVAGADHFLRKPIQPELLPAMISGLWERMQSKMTEPAKTQINDRSEAAMTFPLTPSEQQLVAYLMARPHTTVHRTELATAAFSTRQDPLEVSALVNQLGYKMAQQGIACLIKPVGVEAYRFEPTEGPSCSGTQMVKQLP